MAETGPWLTNEKNAIAPLSTKAGVKIEMASEIKPSTSNNPDKPLGKKRNRGVN